MAGAPTSCGPPNFRMARHPPKIGSLALVQLASAVPLAADFAVARRLIIVHTMFYWPERSQIRKDSLQVIVREISEIPPGHRSGEFTRSHVACTHRPNEQCLVVVGDPGRIGRDVRRCHLFLALV